MADDTRVYTIKFNTKTATRNLEDLENVLRKIEKSDVIKRMKTLDLMLKKVGQSARTTSKVIKNELGTKAKRSLDSMAKSAKDANRELGEMPKTAKRAAVSMRDLGRNLRRYVLLPLGAISIASIKSAFDINKSMANVSTLLDAPIEKVKELKTQVQSLAIESGKGTKDLADGLYQVVSALGESSDNMSQLGVATKASVAGVSGTTEAVSMLTAVAKAYNDTSSESIQKTSDLAFQTVKLGVTTFPELAAAIGKVAPLAAQFNTSQEELFGTMATLTGVTGNTSEVTTQLSSVYSAFMKPSEAMDDAVASINKNYAEYNFQNSTAMLKTLGFKRTIELMGEAAGGSEEELMGIFRRKEAILGILPLISSQSENYTTKVQAMGDAAGSTDEAYRKQTEGINRQGHSFEKTKQRMIVFAQRLGDRLLPVLERLMVAAEPVLKWLENLDEKSIDSAISIGKFVVAITAIVTGINAISTIGGGAIAIIGGIGAASSGSVGGVAALSGAMKGLLGWLGLALAGYAALETAKDLWEASAQPGIDTRESKISQNTAKVDKRLKTMSVAELETASKTEQNIIAELPMSDMAASFESPDKLMQSFASSFGGDVERPLEQAQRQRAESVARKSKIDSELSRRMAKEGQADILGDLDFDLMGMQPVRSGASSGATTTNNVNMNITSNSADPARVAREIERNLSNALNKKDVAFAGTGMR